MPAQDPQNKLNKFQRRRAQARPSGEVSRKLISPQGTGLEDDQIDINCTIKAAPTIDQRALGNAACPGPHIPAQTRGTGPARRGSAEEFCEHNSSGLAEPENDPEYWIRILLDTAVPKALPR